MVRGAWRATVYRVSKSRTRVKQLNTHAPVYILITEKHSPEKPDNINSPTAQVGNENQQVRKQNTTKHYRGKKFFGTEMTQILIKGPGRQQVPVTLRLSLPSIPRLDRISSARV